MSDGDSSKRRVVYPGTFDPITNGHLDVIERGLHLFDEVIVAIAADNLKKPLFSLEERLELARTACRELSPRIEVTVFRGLLVKFVASIGSNAILRGLRAVADFEYEFQLALMNRKLDGGIETIFLMPRDTYAYLSSTIIKEVARLNGNITDFVPRNVESALKEKFGPGFMI